MHASELSIYHTSYLFILRIVLFSIIIHRRVVRVGTQFRDHFCVRESHFKFHTSNFVHQFCTHISYSNFTYKMENLSCQREQSNLHQFHEFTHTGCSILHYQIYVCQFSHARNRAQCEDPHSMRCLFLIHRKTYYTGI